ncbi:hypothetical protein GH714_000590 [Hevea brasiliensis]|uniref:dCMP deaminase n=1 Tax=Hevea brasiliensis TaxID=3981 RepID=A0A6A6LRA8_HEVBR|nr:hypothetical protein GH714_000590 [Hevea brasiliensis]
MNSRELVLLSTATVFGALASALRLASFSSTRKSTFPESIRLPFRRNALLRARLIPPSAKGIGYNGFPRGCSDDKLPWAKKSKTGNPLETKYPYVCHAEVNAILNKNHASAAGQKLYVTMFPCNECAKIIIQSGVSEVIYFVEKNLSNSDTNYVASHKLLSMASVKVRKHQPQMNQILIKFEDS